MYIIIEIHRMCVFVACTCIIIIYIYILYIIIYVHIFFDISTKHNRQSTSMGFLVCVELCACVVLERRETKNIRTRTVSQQ